MLALRMLAKTLQLALAKEGEGEGGGRRGGGGWNCPQKREGRGRVAWGTCLLVKSLVNGLIDLTLLHSFRFRFYFSLKCFIINEYIACLL